MKHYIIDANITYYNEGEKLERNLTFDEFDDVKSYMEHHDIEHEILEESKYFLILRAKHDDDDKYHSSFWHCAMKGVISYKNKNKQR